MDTTSTHKGEMNYVGWDHTDGQDAVAEFDEKCGPKRASQRRNESPLSEVGRVTAWQQQHFSWSTFTTGNKHTLPVVARRHHQRDSWLAYSVCVHRAELPPTPPLIHWLSHRVNEQLCTTLCPRGCAVAPDNENGFGCVIDAQCRCHVSYGRQIGESFLSANTNNE